MKVFLINPSSSLIENSWAYKRFFTPIPSLGLAYIGSVLEKNGIQVRIIDQFASKQSDAFLIELIKKENPAIIGFSALTPVVPDIKRLVAKIRLVNKVAKIVIGNLHATFFSEEILREKLADIVVRKEGEMTMLEICERIRQQKSLENVEGISFMMDGKMKHNPDRKFIDDFDSLPFPAWHLFNLDDYLQHPLVSIKRGRALPILASRGCVYRCYYCSQDKAYSKVRYRDLNKVIDEMEYFNSRFNVGFFGFCDAYFPFDEKSGLKFCDLMIQRGLHKRIKWITETRVDKVTFALLRAMKEAGAHLVMYGIEVGNEAVLNLLNNGTTLAQAWKAVKETRKAGILSQGLFILGLPGETRETCKDTIRFAKKLDCDFVKFNIATPYPGSKFFDDFVQTKSINRLEVFTSWADWTTISEDLAYNPKDITSDTLKHLQRSAMITYYLRPHIILRHMFKKTISFKNIFYGGLWLLTLYYSIFVKKIRNLCANGINN